MRFLRSPADLMPAKTILVPCWCVFFVCLWGGEGGGGDHRSILSVLRSSRSFGLRTSPHQTRPLIDRRFPHACKPNQSAP